MKKDNSGLIKYKENNYMCGIIFFFYIVTVPLTVFWMFTSKPVPGQQVCC